MSCLLWKSVTFLSLVWAVGGQLSGSLRLVGSFGQTGGSSGRLEIYYSGQWGTVCDDSFGSSDARVACRQLGYSTSSTPRYGTVGTLGFSQASSFTRTWLDNLGCFGTESRLINCPANAIGIEDCSHSEDIALVCTGSPSSGDLRLVGNSGQTGGSSGRLEVYYSSRWGTVCDDSFDLSDARVACRQLGYSTSSTPRYGTVGALGFFQASSSTRTWLDNLRCSGFESRLISCPANSIGNEDCTHFEDIALSCTGSFTSYTYPVSSVSIGIGVTIPIVIIFVVVVVVCGLLGRRRRLARIQLTTPVVNNAVSTSVVVTGSNTQTATAYPMQQSMDQKPQYSNQVPPQNMYAPPQPAAPYPTGQYANPQYYPQQLPAAYPTSYPQQPPAAYTQQPPAAYTQQPPAAYPPGEQPPPAQYPTGQLSGGEAPPAYPE